MKKLSTLIFIVTLLMSTVQLFGQEATKEITLEDIYKNGVFREKSISGLRSMNDGEHFTTLEKSRKIVKYSYKTGEVVEIISNTIEPDFDIEDYEFSNDETKILIAANAEYVYRRSYYADYYIYDIQTKKLSKLSDKGKQQFATFSPDNSKIAFARNNNLFIKNLTQNKEYQITNDGKLNHIINGGTDWVYEEEFGFTKAFFWSPDGDQIAYYKFDESEVKVFNMTKYNEDLYPENYAFKYPKAGEKILLLVYMFMI